MALADQQASDLDIYGRVSRNVRLLMAHHGILKQKDLASASGVEATRLNRMLNGRMDWTLDVIDALARHFGVETWLLLSSTEELFRSRWNVVPPGELPSQLELHFDPPRRLLPVLA